MEPEPPAHKGRRELVLPRRAVPFVWAIIVLIIQILLPWAVSGLGPRYGWSPRGPGPWNLSGLIAVVLGLALYTWCLVFHYMSYRASVRVGFSPPRLVVGGPYRVSRNPMYAAGLSVWFGWAVFFGSPAVMIALVLLWVVFASRIIPHEGRQLERLFGDDYLQYKRSVGRWVGRF
jgi:protein-S-isoprenylcysteine O-methyltransferase Ste14